MNRTPPTPLRAPACSPPPLAALSVALLACALAACGVDVKGPDPPRDRLIFPVGMALHPDGQYLYVVNSNFDIAYRADRGGTVTVIDTDALTILPESTVQLGSFGGGIALNRPAEGGPTRAYVPVRGDNSVTVLDITEDGSGLSCNGSSFTAECRIILDQEDPFGVVVDTFTAELDGAGTTELDFVAVAHLLGNSITAFTLRDNQPATVNPTATPLVSGANALARSPRNGQFYTIGRFSGQIVGFRPAFDTSGDVISLYQTAEIPIEHASPYSGLDSRAILFNADGTEAYVTNRGPNSLLFVDTGPSNVVTNTGTRNRIVAQLPLPSDPAELALVQVADATSLLYVASYDDEALLVVDPDLKIIVGRVDLPASPYAMVADTARHKRLYVTLFDAQAIAIVDLDPASPSFNQVTAVLR